MLLKTFKKNVMVYGVERGGVVEKYQKDTGHNSCSLPPVDRLVFSIINAVSYCDNSGRQIVLFYKVSYPDITIQAIF